jgi:GT2 family glycosyltransferase
MGIDYMDKEDNDLVVIINSYNRLALMKDSITSLCNHLNFSNIGFAIVIYDAGSQDGSIKWINDYIKNSPYKIFLIDGSSDIDTSFSHGVNMACNFAIRRLPAFKYFFLYETDNYLLSAQPIKEAISLLRHYDIIAACGFTVKKHDGTNAGFGCTFPSIFSFILGQQFSFFLKLNEPTVKWTSHNTIKFGFAEVVYTSPLLIKKDIWSQLNGMDSLNFPFSDCDIDFAFRLSKHGGKMAIIKSNGVIHDNKQVNSSWSATRTINFYKARNSYFKKHFGTVINVLKPLLMFMHLIELFILTGLYIFGRTKVESLKTRWLLVKTVFNNYVIKP